MTREEKHNQLVELLLRVMREQSWNYDVIDAKSGEIIIPAGRTMHVTLLKRVAALPEILLHKYQRDE